MEKKKQEYIINSSFYGKKFRGFKLYYSGFKEQPKLLQKDGRGFSGGKHILEVLTHKLKKFELTLTSEKKSQIKKVGKKYFVYLAISDIRILNSSKIQKTREIGLKLTNNHFSQIFPKFFNEKEKFFSYERGMFAELLTRDFNPAILSRDDLNSLTAFLPKIYAQKKGKNLDVASVYKNKQSIQLLYLEKLVSEYEDRTKKKLSESNWQEYFRKYILLFQDGYIKKLEKINIGIEIKFPDFCVITADDYLDVIEIKVPSTRLLLQDKSHKNYYWSSELTKAISQTEKYIDTITKHAAQIRTNLADKHGINLRIIKPRGIVIAGSFSEFDKNKEKADDFRLLNEGLKNITVIPYDELARRVRNTIFIINDLSDKKGGKKKSIKSKR
ncbi:MAG: DUF4263 domain-containing protein [Candidatus Berkelbacteria bacterium]|nr:DUF4263 domain-containing protein [Candidatus Berkelbacteria bacterium]